MVSIIINNNNKVFAELVSLLRDTCDPDDTNENAGYQLVCLHAIHFVSVELDSYHHGVWTDDGIKLERNNLLDQFTECKNVLRNEYESVISRLDMDEILKLIELINRFTFRIDETVEQEQE